MNQINLMHGDCLELMKEIPDNSVDMVLTDPPYGMDFQSNRSKEGKKYQKIKGDKKPFIWFLRDAYRILKNDSCIMVFTDWKNQEVFKMALDTAGFKVKSQVVWNREHHGMGDLKGAFAPMHDIAWFATKGKYQFKGKRPKDVLSHKRIGGNESCHPTMKPVSLNEEILNSTTAENDIVLDCFMGSGSTGVACKNLNRKFIGIELDDKYFEIAKERIDSLGGYEETYPNG